MDWHNIKKTLRTIIGGTVFLILSMSLHAQTNAAEIISDTYILGATGDVSIIAKMSIITSRGEKNRTIKVLVRRHDGTTKILATITDPSFLSNIKYLYHRNASGTESKWLRTSRGVRLLSGAQRSESLFDSHFTADDLSDIDLQNFIYTRIEAHPTESASRDVPSPDLSSRNLTCVEATPSGSSQFSLSKRYFVDSDTGSLHSIEYRSADGELYKRYTVTKTETVNGEIFVTESVMEDLRQGGRTILQIEAIETGAIIPDRMFNRGNL